MPEVRPPKDDNWKTVTIPEARYCELMQAERERDEANARADCAEKKRDRIYGFCEEQLDYVHRNPLSQYLHGVEVTALAVLAAKHAKPAAPPLDSPASEQQDYQDGGISKEPAATVKESLIVQPAAAESERDLQAIVEAVEDAVGHSHFGWDMVKPSEIVAAVLKHAATPEPAAAVEGTGEKARAEMMENPLGIEYVEPAPAPPAETPREWEVYEHRQGNDESYEVEYRLRLRSLATQAEAAAAARDIQAMAAMRKYEMTITGYRFVERYKWIISNAIGIYHDDPADAILALAAELEKGVK